MMKRLFSVSAAIGAAGLMSAPASAVDYNLSGGMDVLQAGTNGNFGIGSGNGSGTIAGTYDDITNLLNYTITWQNLGSAVTSMHFHMGAPTVNGSVELGISSPWASPQMGSAVLTATNESNLLNGDWYVNVHTVDFGGGEIRGQVIVTPVPEPTTAALGLIAVVGLAVRRRRR